jgi:hypothetical protein
VTGRPDSAQLERQVVARLAGLLPAAGTSLLAERVAELRLRPQHAKQLRDHLAAHDDALVSGNSDGPAAFLRLLDVLADDLPGVQRARCVICHEVKRLARRADGGRLCAACYARSSAEECARCGKVRPVTARRNGKAVCSRCSARDPSRWQACFICGKKGRVFYRVDDRPLCRSCGPRVTRPCGSCGRDEPVQANTPDGPLCGRCYKRSRAYECQRCRREVHNRRRTADGALLCEQCWSPPALTCSRCGETRPCKIGSEAGRPICEPCRNRARSRRPCVLCRDLQHVHARLPLGEVCGACYTNVRRRPGRCAGCGKARPLIGMDDQQRRVCGPCAGDDRGWVCRTCGTFAALVSEGRCPDCIARDRVDRLLARPDGHRHTQLEPLRRLLQAEIDTEPLTVIIWLQRAAWAELLNELATSHAQITHATLDARLQGRHVHYLRTVLVNTGVLPARAEDLESTPAWLEEVLARMPAKDARLIRPYAVWSVLRRARNRARRRPATRGARKYIRGRILLASRFLAWLDEHDLTLQTVTQAHLDQWLEGGTTTHRRLRDFLTWANARGLTGSPLTVPPLVDEREPADLLDDDQRWQLLKRCLHEERVELPLRVAAALILLYAQVPSKIVTLTTEHITRTGANTYLALDAQPVLVPPRLADLLTRLADSTPTGRRPLIEHRPHQDRLLFPGSHPGRPMDPDRLSRQLSSSLGLRIRPARNAALCALAADLPAPVLADLLGLHITTAVKWVRLVRRDWTDYLAARAGHPRRQPGMTNAVGDVAVAVGRVSGVVGVDGYGRVQ